MNLLPQHAPHRAERIQLGEGIPAVLRGPEGGCKQAELRTVSLTGGLLSLPRGLNQGSFFRLMFVTHTGPVLGTAEMLSPVSNNLQPFRFVSLHRNDQRRLGAAIQTCLEPAVAPEPDQQQWIEKFRAATVNRKPSRGRYVKIALCAATFISLSLVGVFYVFHIYVR